MKLYVWPGTCALATHIALLEAGAAFQTVQANIFDKTLADGSDYLAINLKGTVPALVDDDGAVWTETVALLDWVAQQSEALKPRTAQERARQLEMLAFLATEVQKPFAFTYFVPGDDAAATLRAFLESRLEFLARGLDGPYLLAGRYSVADALLYVLLRWADAAGYAPAPALVALRDRVEARPAVRRALAAQALAPVRDATG
jgi:glutathione S-transferase